jgi:group II intron reverse transcriptase/maturase
VCSNGGAPGIDGVTVSHWKAHEEQNLGILRRQLIEDRCPALPVRRVEIPKPGKKGETRPLGIPCVSERVCQQAVSQQLSPVFEDLFFEDSHGFRPGHSTHTASRRIEELRKAGYVHAVDLDIKNFFGTVDHDIMMRLVKRVVKDRRVLGLIRGWLKAGVMLEGEIRYETSGTPQGGTISPLLSNIYLTPFDLELQKAGVRHVRYADDVVLLCKTREESEATLQLAREILSRLKLSLSEEKTKVTSFQEGFDFLGFRFRKSSRGVGDKSLRNFHAKVREKTKRQQGNRLWQTLIDSLNPLLRGWANYHRHGNNRGLFKKLDKWIRNRVRAYARGRWRDRGRWKLLPAEQLAKAGLQSLYDVIFGTGQRLLFGGSL